MSLSDEEMDYDDVRTDGPELGNGVNLEHSDGEMSEEERAREMMREYEEREKEIERQNRLRWPSLFKDLDDSQTAGTSKPADERDGEEQKAVDHLIAKQLQEKEAQLAKQAQRQKEREDREQLLAQIEVRERALRQKEKKLESTFRQVEQLRKTLEEESKKKEDLLREKVNKAFMADANKIQENVEDFANVVKLRLQALSSMYCKADAKGKSANAESDTERLAPLPVLAGPSPGLETPGRIGTQKDFYIPLKSGQHKWKEGDDYRIWRRIMCLELAKYDCLFMVDQSVKPQRQYSAAELVKISSAVMVYILSNFPEKYQWMLETIHTPQAMLRELDSAIIPPSHVAENNLQIQIMNLYHDPQKESVVEFRARVQQLVNKIRQHPDHELTNTMIRRNVLGAIAEAYPEIHKEAVKNPRITINQIYDRMSEDKDTHKDSARRATQSAMMAGTSKAGPSGQFSRKRKGPVLQGDSAVTEKKQGTCFRCGFSGHWIAQCTNPKKGCYNCKGFGHIARECRKPHTPEYQEFQKPNPAKRTRRGAKKNKGTPAQQRLEQQQKALKGKQKTQVKSVVKKVAPEPRREVAAAIATPFRRSGGSDSSFASAMSFEGKGGQLNFIADSGACEHMVNDASVFAELRTLTVPVTILCANKDEKASLEVTQIGDIIVYNQETRKHALLANVLYAPGLVQNLFSIRKQINRGLVATFNSDTLEIVDKNSGEIVKRGNFMGRFWWLSFELPMLNESRESNLKQVRKMRNHLNLATLDETQKECTKPQTEQRKRKLGQTKGESQQKGKRSRLALSEESLGSVDLESVAAEQGTGSQSQERLRDVSGLKWHHRLNHASKKYLELAAKVMPELKGIQFGSELLDCTYCKLAKAKRKPCTQQRHRSDQPFHRLYSDLVGPLKPGAFRSQAKYFVTFTDDATRYAFAYEIKDKTQVNHAFSSCLEDIRKLSGPYTKVSELRVDGGMEYQTTGMKSLLKSEGVAVTVCEPYTPQHNGTAERLNLELEEKIRVNLLASGVPTYLWPFTMKHVLHVHNRTPNASNEFRSPYEVLKNEVPSIKHLRRYGCEAYVLDPKAKQKSKLAPRANLYFLVECGDTGYTLFHPIHRTVTRSKDVDFIEDRTYSDYKGDSKTCKELPEFEEVVPESTRESELEVRGEGSTDNVREENLENNVEKESLENNVSEENFQTEIRTEEPPSTSRKIGEIGDYEFFEEEEEEAHLMCLLNSELETGEQEPVTYKDAMGSRDAMNWKTAINQEFSALEQCETWKLVDRSRVPRGVKVMSTRWVHKRKLEANGEIRFRSRLVARGFADTNSYELSEIYAPVARLPDVRFILIAAAKYGLDLTQLDVKTAFLNGSLDKLVYIELPEGYVEYLGKRRKPKPNSVCEVHRALYGLKVSPRRWFERFLEAVEKLKFTAYKFQACLFIWKDGEKLAIILLYVDDILLASNCPKKTAEVKSMLREEFSITDLGSPKKFLGLQIVREENGAIRLHQTQHIESMLKKFNSGNHKTYETPMLPDFGDGHKDLKENPQWNRANIPYRQVIGTLLYIQNGTRPDISYAVNVLSRRQADFGEKHWNAVKRVMGYLAATKDLYLKFSPTSDTIDCYVDASLGMSAEHGHSTTGFVVYMFGCPVTWRTQKQNHVSLSSAEAEFVAMSKACRELSNLQTMCLEILDLNIIPRIHEDSKPAIRLAEVDDSSTLKHLVRLSYLYVREQYKNGNIEISWVGTEHQVGDSFTKPLSKSKFLRFRNRLLNH